LPGRLLLRPPGLERVVPPAHPRLGQVLEPVSLYILLRGAKKSGLGSVLRQTCCLICAANVVGHVPLVIPTPHFDDVPCPSRRADKPSLLSVMTVVCATVQNGRQHCAEQRCKTRRPSRAHPLSMRSRQRLQNATQSWRGERCVGRGDQGRTSVAMVWPMEVASACISVVLILLRSSADKVVVCPIGTTCCGSFGADIGFDDRILAMSVLNPSSRFQPRQGSCDCRRPNLHGRRARQVQVARWITPHSSGTDPPNTAALLASEVAR